MVSFMVVEGRSSPPPPVIPWSEIRRSPLQRGAQGSIQAGCGTRMQPHTPSSGQREAAAAPERALYVLWPCLT